ncbi:RHS repeat domain-containing protein [Pseudomonas capsici]|uniref:RHS repeat domain-containing protein n=1 Tax=Pseudomonas capsici TaxID=2810614 RepID=UPI0021F217BC|nr:RHS repeat-associated core domain-containing protein [Pseudomonas capsici]MCV4281378.1 hypothetical protein [Pseudomonas capsici]
MNMALHAHTPTLVVTEPRGLLVRSVAFHRREQNQPADERVNRQTHDAAGRLISQRDPRLAQPNLLTTYSLSGQPLLTDSVDAGWRLGLLGEAEQIVAEWDGRGSQRQIEYDVLLRPLAITEQGRVSERFTYGGPDAFEHNQCNQLTRHDDTAGALYWSDYGVPGSALSELRRFLQTVETPDWPLPEAERDVLLEAIPLETRWAFNAVGDPLLHTDAMGHAQHFSQTVAGQLKTVQLTLAGATQAQTLVSDIRYNAFDQIEQETAGNGIVSRSLYDPQDGRLMERSAEPLQHLIYSYDPVGNILQIEDRAQPVRFFANQQVEPISHYRYDTLYQLIEATGREVSNGASHGPALPDLQPLPPDPNQVSNYTQSYDYDRAGNLLQMSHVGAQPFTRNMRVTPDSNRSLPAGEVDTDFNEAFDANGNLLQLIRGQTLEWDLRNQLQQIITVTRATAASDQERYIYDSLGQRCRKISSTQTASRTLLNEVRYLPGLEIRTSADGEVLHVLTVDKVRVLHWQAGKPDGIANDQIRYSLTDHLGSSTLELDQQGGLISQESYYPFGGTSWWAARSALEAKYKTIRYSSKERDASGLYYYGFRYYAPWLQRWINPDPAGTVNGLNIFCFVGNNPILNRDPDGRVYRGRGDEHEQSVWLSRHIILHRGLGEFPQEQREKLKSALIETHVIFQDALYMIKAHPEESSEIMQQFFGQSYKDVKNTVIEAWEQTFMLAAEYRGELGEDKILGVKMAPDSTSRAYIRKNDPEGRIILGTRHIDSPDLATLIGHELTHLGKVSGSPIRGAESKDYYYLNSTDTLLIGLSKTQQRRITAGAISGGNLSVLNVEGKTAFIEKIQSLHPFPEMVTELGSAVEAFKQFPQIRSHIAAGNADTLIHSAHQLHKLFKKTILPALRTQQARQAYT